MSYNNTVLQLHVYMDYMVIKYTGVKVGAVPELALPFEGLCAKNTRIKK